MGTEMMAMIDLLRNLGIPYSHQTNWCKTYPHMHHVLIVGVQCFVFSAEEQYVGMYSDASFTWRGRLERCECPKCHGKTSTSLKTNGVIEHEPCDQCEETGVIFVEKERNR